MGRIVLRVEGILPDDPELAYEVSPEDAMRIIMAHGELFGPFIQDDDPPRPRTPREILRRMVDDWMASIMATVHTREAEAARAAVVVPPPVTLAVVEPEPAPEPAPQNAQRKVVRITRPERS
jgi:hypothetical protein